MTPEQTAGAARASVSEIGTAFSEAPRTLRRARLIGLSGWAFHVAGRAGALGDVRAETAAAVLGFIAPEAVADGWDGARRVASPVDIAGHNLAECCRWGVENLGDFPRVARLVELAGRVVAAADAAGLPLFAAWRAMPVPDDSPGARAAALLLLLREHRAGAHLLAVRASGMTPLEAIIAGPEGEGGALAYGWTPPFPPAEPLIRRSLWADAVADGITAGAYAALGTAERVELVGLLESVLAGLRAVPAGNGDPDGPVGGRPEPGSQHADRSP
ncbi:SCO6745 family protein [Polymorphospora rubra]|uniref:SCO6745 family protein n=1 Tax=Polymorphospora rubra TaxID=338584 RepID=UPI0033EDE117